MGLEVSQNREVMQLAGFNLVGGVDGPVIAPALIKQRWQYRADYNFTVRQLQEYTYAVLDLKGAQVTISSDNGLPNINVPVAPEN